MSATAPFLSNQVLVSKVKFRLWVLIRSLPKNYLLVDECGG